MRAAGARIVASNARSSCWRGESVFYMKNVRDEGVAAANAKHRSSFTVDVSGGVSVGWRAFADVHSAWQWVKDAL